MALLAAFKLGVIASVVVLMLTAASVVSTVNRIETERTTREDFQIQAVETFASQPARHPHRMVHYGHYVFREPPPLSVIEPGVDAFSGTVMFLEGASPKLGGFSPRYSGAQAGQLAELSPAFVYQTLLPLLLIVLGLRRSLASAKQIPITNALRRLCQRNAVVVWQNLGLGKRGTAESHSTSHRAGGSLEGW